MDSLQHFCQRIKEGKRSYDLDLLGADLSHADLSYASADRINFQTANLRYSKLCEARLGTCNFAHAQMEESDWTSATIRMCVFDGALMAGARFDDAHLEDSSARGADFTRASLRGTQLTETLFERAMLCRANLDAAQGDGVQFRGADLRGARLTSAKLDEADFRGADLRGADLSNGRFQAADFRGALLDNTVFAGADLEGAMFDADYVRESEATAGAASDPQRPDDALQLLEKALSVLTGTLEQSGSPFAELQNQLRQALGAAAERSPGQLVLWLNSLAEMAANGKVSDIGELLGAEGAAIIELYEKLQHFAALDGGSDQLPKEWRLWLEPLVQTAAGGQLLDLNALIETIAAATQKGPPADLRPYGMHRRRSAGVKPGRRRRRKPRR